MKSLESEEARELYKKSINTLPFHFMIIDAIDKFKIITINKQMALSFGKSEEELIGKNLVDYLSQDTKKKMIQSANQVIKNNKSVTFEDTRHNRTFKTSIFPLKNNKDIITYLLVYAEDITYNKKMRLQFKINEDELEDTTLKLLKITENAKIGLYYTDTQGKFLWANKEAAEIVGKSREEIIGKTGKYLLDIKTISKKDYLKALKILTLVKLGKNVGPEIFTLNYKDGGEKVIEIRAQKINLHDKDVVLGIVKDVTENKIIETNLKESEEKFNILTNQSLMGSGFIQDNKIIYANDAISQITGYSKEELLKEGAKILLKIIHPDDISFVSEQLKKKLAGNKDVINKYSCKIITKTGKIKWIEVYSKTIKYKKKNADFITVIDITDLKKTENNLKKSEQKFRDLAEQSPNMIFINKKGKIAYFNQKCIDIMGYSREEFQSNKFNFLNLIAPESHKILENALQNHMNGKDIPAYEYLLLSKNGVKLNALITTKLIEYEGESATLGIVTDISKMKKIELELLKGKNYLQNVIDSTSEIIFTIGVDNKIKMWNNKGVEKTGYKKKNVIGKSIKQLNLFDNSDEIEEYIKNIQNKKTATIKEISINTIYGFKRTLSVSPSFVKDESNSILEILFVCRDVTKEKEKYGDIKSGNCYIIQETNKTIGLDIFNSLIESKKLGLYIGRISNKEIQTFFKNNNPKIIKLTLQKEDLYPIANNIEEIYQNIKDFIKNKKNTVILIDRFDYLIINKSFESLMNTLYKINDLIRKQESIFLLRVNPAIIDQTQIAILSEEFKKLPSQKISDIQISGELYEILMYIQNESKNNITVTYGTIGKSFSISKVTVKKRLESLIDSGLIYSRKKGKTKILNITEKGKNLLKN